MKTLSASFFVIALAFATQANAGPAWQPAQKEWQQQFGYKEKMKDVYTQYNNEPFKPVNGDGPFATPSQLPTNYCNENSTAKGTAQCFGENQ